MKLAGTPGRLAIIFLVCLISFYSFALTGKSMAENTQANIADEGIDKSVYIVRKGDTVWSIAQEFDSNVTRLIELNGTTFDEPIYVGQPLIVPTVKKISHIVQAGDTLWDLAKRYNLGIEDIIEVNNIAHPDHLTLGDQLVIPAEKHFNGRNGAPVMASRNKNKTLLWPVSGPITSGFGERWGEFHHGLDIAVSLKTPIHAAASGKVVFSGWRGVYGRAIIIEHNANLSTLYGHGSKLLVKEGDTVKVGEVIALSGSSGRSTGPHVHFEVIIDGKHTNPMKMLP